jgi:hypothetical protein
MDVASPCTSATSTKIRTIAGPPDDLRKHNPASR